MIETLIYSDFIVGCVRKSIILPNTKVMDRSMERLRCPKCHTLLLPLLHGERKTCSCGLILERWGNALDLISD